jgi:hypothetical protein
VAKNPKRATWRHFQRAVGCEMGRGVSEHDRRTATTSDDPPGDSRQSLHQSLGAPEGCIHSARRSQRVFPFRARRGMRLRCRLE